MSSRTIPAGLLAEMQSATPRLAWGILIERPVDAGQLALTGADIDAASLPSGYSPVRGTSFAAPIVEVVGDVLHEGGAVDVVGQLREDDLLLAVLHLLGVGDAADADDASAGAEVLLDALLAVDDAAGREVRAGDVLAETADRRLGVVDQVRERAADLPQFGVRQPSGPVDDALGVADDFGALGGDEGLVIIFTDGGEPLPEQVRRQSSSERGNMLSGYGVKNSGGGEVAGGETLTDVAASVDAYTTSVKFAAGTINSASARARCPSLRCLRMK